MGEFLSIGPRQEIGVDTGSVVGVAKFAESKQIGEDAIEVLPLFVFGSHVVSANLIHTLYLMVTLKLYQVENYPILFGAALINEHAPSLEGSREGGHCGWGD